MGGLMTEETKDFIIKDRRIFAEENKEPEERKDHKETAKEDTDSREAPDDTAAQKAEPEAEPKAKKDDHQEAEAEPPLPEINFATFIFSLNSSALVQLGLIEDPSTGKKVKNLALAKQTIDILGVLEEKTRGNLSDDEENMLKNILYDLRMIYVKEKG
jgi:hypothetical protein